MRTFTNMTHLLRRFARDESGVATLQFILVFPIFILFFGMTYESGMISLRHVMLERGVDLTVRDVRIGAMADPSRESLKRRICANALILPDCENQLRLEIFIRDAHSWVNIPTSVACVDRGNPAPPDEDDARNQLNNNQLVILRACARFDPVLPTTGIGKSIVESSAGNTAAAGSYALVSTASFVVEPFKRAP